MNISTTRQPKRIKARFIGPFALMLAFVMCVFAVAIYSIEARIRDRDADLAPQGHDYRLGRGSLNPGLSQ